jgi:hypothetical protein
MSLTPAASASQHPTGFEPGIHYEAGQPASVTLRFAEQTPTRPSGARRSSG